MTRGRLVLLLVPLVAAALLVFRSPHDDRPATRAPDNGSLVAPVVEPTRRDVQRQHDVDVDVEALQRQRLLDVVRVRPWEAHGLRILAGSAPTGPREPQDIWITPALPALTLEDIARRMRRVCRELDDRCAPRDYRLLVTTTAGMVPLQLRGRTR